MAVENGDFDPMVTWAIGALRAAVFGEEEETRVMKELHLAASWRYDPIWSVETLARHLSGDAARHRMATAGPVLVETALRLGSVEAFQFLVTLDASAVHENPRRFVDFAVRRMREATRILECLVTAGVDIAAADKAGGGSLVLAAIQQEIRDLLQEAERKSSLLYIADLMERKSTGDYYADHIRGDAANVVEFLLRHGADANAANSEGDTPLHIACREQSNEALLRSLLKFGAKQSLRVRNEAHTLPLHEAVRSADSRVVMVLLNAGADALAPLNGESPLHMAIFSLSFSVAEAYNLAYVLVAYGAATWDDGCEGALQKGWQRERPMKHSDEEGITTRSRLHWQSGLRACVLHWDQERADGIRPTHVPMESLQRGYESVQVYLQGLQKSSAHELVRRRKVCVVGPSEWGKTSLIKSLTTSTPSLVHPDEGRTIGIDLFGYKFVESSDDDFGDGPAKRHAVTFWDFAGQDVYQVAHALFFSKRTLYLVCVDLEAYNNTKRDAEAQPSMRQGEAIMHRFVRKNIFRWLRLIFVRQPDAEFVIVGTKADCLDDSGREATIKRLWCDLQSRLLEWKRSFVAEIDDASRVLEVEEICTSAISDAFTSFDRSGTERNPHVSSLHDNVYAILAGEWLVASSAETEAVYAACEALEKTVVSSDRSYLMPAVYSRVLQAIQTRRDTAAKLTPKDRVEHTIMPFHSLCVTLVQEVEGLKAEECRAIIQTLHDLGDVLWYEHDGAGALRECVILDPTIVLDLVREVVNHKHTDEGEGRVTHEKLLQMTLWKALDDELVLAFKLLLQYFQLAYPADNEAMDWNSDLIVPTYWKVKPDAAGNNATSSTLSEADPTLCWEYELSSEVSETVFDNLAVQSHLPMAQHRVRSNCIESTDPVAQVSARVALVQTETASRDVIRLEVQSGTGDQSACWHCLRFFVMALENVLDAYPGLTVSRYVVDSDKRHRVNGAVKALQDAAYMGKSEEDVREQFPWLPPGDFNWFVEKAWRRPGALHELRMRGQLRDATSKLDVLRKLVATDDIYRKYPALWTLEYGEDEIVVKMLSDLSGVCFHEPIRVAVPLEFIAKHGSLLQAGLSVCSNVIPEVVSLGILNKILSISTPLLVTSITSASKVHNLISKLDLAGPGNAVVESQAKLSPRGAVALLRELLTIYSSSFDEFAISEISNLHCAATADGRYVWAHRHEIMAMKDELTPCDPVDVTVGVISNPTTTKPAGGPLLPGILPQPTAFGDPPSPVAIQLSVTEVVGLPPWDWRRVYCKWQLFHRKDASPLASGATPQQSRNVDAWEWSVLSFSLPGVLSTEMLRECRLEVEVKRPSRCLGLVKLIGKGVVSLDAVVTKQAAGSEFPIRVALQDPAAKAKPVSTPQRWATCMFSTRGRAGAA